MPDRLYARASARIGHHAALILVVAILLTNLVADLGVGYLYLQQRGISDCFRTYLAKSAPLATDRDAAIQQLWDDFSLAQHATSPPAQAKLRTRFFADLGVERAANKALQEYRRDHPVGQSCQ